MMQEMFLRKVNSLVRIEDELALREAVNRDSDESLNIYAIIMSHGRKSSPIVYDSNEYRIESPMYNLIIGLKSRFRNGGEAPSDPGEYNSIMGGFFLIVRSMQVGQYRIKFGGVGRGNYATHSTYDISVRDKRRNLVSDVSNQLDSSFPSKLGRT